MFSTPLSIQGGTALGGEIAVQSSKNASLPLLAAALLTREPVVLRALPQLSDVRVALEILEDMGTRVRRVGSDVELHTPELRDTAVPDALARRFRASILFLGAVLGRAGEVQVAQPGGCNLGPRPIDQHVLALRELGAEVSEEGEHIRARRSRSSGGEFVFDMLSVGGTQNAMLASVLGGGITVLENASADTDVVELAAFLNRLGARIEGAGSHTVTIQGVSELGGGEFEVIPDRIEAGTLLMAAAATRGEVSLSRARPDHLRAVLHKLRQSGVRIRSEPQRITLDARGAELKPVRVNTQEYPGFPTDLQPQMTAYLATVPGISVITDRIYPERVTHATELARMGGVVQVNGPTLLITGSTLTGARVQAHNLRSGAALVIAGLAAQGETVISGVEHIARGYEDLCARLASLGARIRQDPEGA